MKPTTILSLFALLIASSLRAADLTAPVEPYIDAKTVLVVRIDADRLDMEAIHKWWNQSTQAAAPETREMRAIVQSGWNGATNYVDAFRRAGGRTLFFVVSLGDSPSG